MSEVPLYSFFLRFSASYCRNRGSESLGWNVADYKEEANVFEIEG